MGTTEAIRFKCFAFVEARRLFSCYCDCDCVAVLHIWRQTDIRLLLDEHQRHECVSVVFFARHLAVYRCAHLLARWVSTCDPVPPSFGWITGRVRRYLPCGCR